MWDEERARVRASSHTEERGMWTPTKIGWLPIEKAVNPVWRGGVEEGVLSVPGAGKRPFVAYCRWGCLLDKRST